MGLSRPVTAGMSLVLILCLLPFSNSFSTKVSPTRQKHFSFSLSQSASYGRGAEIWPECNEEQIRLQDSFPGGKIPGSVMAALQQKDVGKTPEPSGGGLLSRVWGKTLSFNSVDRLPAVIALTLLLKGLVRPLDIMIVSAITGYTVILHSFARSTRDDGITPTVPALPPQGHVPDLVLNPLGLSFTNSDEYDTWLKSGVILSLFLPLAVIFRRTSHQMDAVRACARPLFLLCGQALGESLTRQFLSPLPIRILVPVLFNTVRLGPLIGWVMTPTGPAGKLLAALNLAYWSINLFGYLIPIATMRYLRAYFLCVEAEQVVTRPGFENAAGLLP